jgi:hypothetical protein
VTDDVLDEVISVEIALRDCGVVVSAKAPSTALQQRKHSSGYWLTFRPSQG